MVSEEEIFARVKAASNDRWDVEVTDRASYLAVLRVLEREHHELHWLLRKSPEWRPDRDWCRRGAGLVGEFGHRNVEVHRW